MNLKDDVLMLCAKLSDGVLRSVKFMESEKIEKFSLLERRIDKLLESYTAFSEENKHLKEQLRLEVQKADALKARLELLDKEKSEMREKMDSLIDRIDLVLQGV